MARAGLVSRVSQARSAGRGNVHVAAARPAQAATGVGPGHPAGPQRGLGQGHPAKPARNPAPAPAPSATAPPPPAAAGKPWDSTAERESGAAQQKYGDTLAGLEGDWRSREDWYGLGAEKNPYSQAALLERRHEVDRRTNLNTSGLSLYSGSLVNSQAGADKNYDVNLESLKAAFYAEQEENQRKKEQAQHEWEQEQAQINEEAIERAEETEPAPAPGAEPAGGGGGGKKGKGGGGKKGGGFQKNKTISSGGKGKK